MGYDKSEKAQMEFGEGKTLARINKGKLHFEIIVDLKDAIKVRKGESDYLIIEGDTIFTNAKRGDRASKDDLEISFGTADISEIGKIIVKKGEILVDQEHRSAEQEKRFKQVVEFLATNAIDPQTKNPITPERIKSALEQAKVNIKPTSIDGQMKDILEELSKVIPIKIETKKVKIIIPAMHTGQAYGVITQYKENENWMPDGSLEVIVNVPAGAIMDFYDRLNSVTHGSALTEDVE